MNQFKLFFVILSSMISLIANSNEIISQRTNADLENDPFNETVWKSVKPETVSLMAQPMAVPRPKQTNTSNLYIQSTHNSKWIAFRMTWSAPQHSAAGKLGQYSDAIAIQFPVNDNPLPPVFMGAKDMPVHIIHWRAQYQNDVEKGKPEMKDLYPNMSVDMYPMEFKDAGKIRGLTEEKREQYAPAKAAGNPQSYQKRSAIDEIIAEGFGSSSAVENTISKAHGKWANGQWEVIIARPLQIENGSPLNLNKTNHMAFAIWQGAKQEVGSRKCVTMSWIPLKIEDRGF